MIHLTGKLLEKYNSSSACAKDLNSITTNLAKRDSSLWGSTAQVEAKARLNWVDLPTTSRALLPQLDALNAFARSNNLTNVILCGMGGSSLAPEVIAKTHGKKLTVLDTTDPDQILLALPESLVTTVVVIGSKSGSTIETSSHFALFKKLFTDADLDPTQHLIIVTDLDSPLDIHARKNGFRVINADSSVGGRYSALTAFGLTPAALLGIDVSVLLDDADAARESFANPDSSVVQVAVLLFEQVAQCVALCDSKSSLPGISDWIEQLIAESTGKNLKGRLPVVIESPLARFPSEMPIIGFSEESDFDLNVMGTLGSQFIFWEWVTALLARALDIDPFNQPNVTEAKERTSNILSSWITSGPTAPEPIFEDNNLAIYAEDKYASLDSALASFLKTPVTYFAVMAFLNRDVDGEIFAIRELISRITDTATTFGWGPRFLHSTGQYHKGGQQNGAFIQITGENCEDLEIPEKDFSFHTLLMAQALGDGQALQSRNLPLLRIHLKNRKTGLTSILESLKVLGGGKKP